MISDVVKLILQEKDSGRKYFYENLCLRWQKEKIVVSAREDEKYMVKKYNPKDYLSLDYLCEAIENDYCIVLVFNFY